MAKEKFYTEEELVEKVSDRRNLAGLITSNHQLTGMETGIYSVLQIQRTNHQ